MTPRSAAEQCQIDCDEYRKEEPSCYGYDFGNAWRKGHAAGLAEAEELVAAADKLDKRMMECDHFAPSVETLLAELRVAIARFKAVKGE